MQPVSKLRPALKDTGPYEVSPEKPSKRYCVFLQVNVVKVTPYFCTRCILRMVISAFYLNITLIRVVRNGDVRGKAHHHDKNVEIDSEFYNEATERMVAPHTST